MRKYTIYILCVLMSGSFISCKKYLEQVPDDRITIEEVFQKKGPSEDYLANVYSYIQDPSSQYTSVPWAGNSDEIEVAWARYIMFKMNIGNWTPTSGYYDIWGNSYQGIRSATYFLNHIGGNQEILRLSGQQLIDQYKGEARFVRAYLYFSLMRQYGPVVLVGDTELPPDAATNDLQLPRSSFDECVAYLAGELDKAAEALPVTPVDDRSYGRATRGVALALKSRLLLYAASPLYNGNNDYAGFRNKDGKQLISQSADKERWKAAANAAKAVIDLNTYTLYTGNGDPVNVYNNIFFTGYNSEVIFSRKANDLYWWDVNSSPRAAGGYAGVGPTQEMVDAYNMKDGLPITQSPLYRASGFTDGVYNMYLNREPRFYASILYHGVVFKGGNITSPRQLNFFRNGADGRYEGTEDFTHTGYLVHKGISPVTNPVTGQFENRGIILFRLSEVYLNYAEALNEYSYDNHTEVLKYLNGIRKRAGIPMYGEGDNALPVPADQLSMRQAIRSERRIELAFETHRWFDIRRWKIARDVMKPVYGMNVDGTNADEFFRRTQVAERAWREAYNWFPIPQYEIDRARLVVQNPGW